MNTDFDTAWQQFTTILKLFQKDTLLNPPCNITQISEVEKSIQLAIPGDLKALLGYHNGQQIDELGIKNGIFKSLSGWNLYERHLFLSVAGIQVAYQAFINDPVLVAAFGKNEIPFAIAGVQEPGQPVQYNEAFCMNSITGMISLIWTVYPDPWNPPEWQIARFTRAASLEDFIKKQIEFY